MDKILCFWKMGAGSGTEGGQSLTRIVPAGACPHFVLGFPLTPHDSLALFGSGYAGLARVEL